jgi:septal ring factor EnvC (AmiA/AmiB activator)
MRALRERPRLVAAKFALALAALLATALVAAAIASDDSNPSPDLQRRLERTEQLRRNQLGELQRQAVQIARLRVDLRTTTRQASDRARTRERLRRQLRAARRERAAVTFRPRHPG